MQEIEEWNGWAVPTRDSNNVRHRRIEQGSYAMECLKKMFPKGGTCIQAGANWGYWPLRMAKIFDLVYTFEPDPICFSCMAQNTWRTKNVFRYQAALGNERNLVDLWRDKDTTGNQQIEGEGPIPTLKIDDLGLQKCDLIYLDIEGQECNAIRGAMETIKRCKPVVIYEERQAFVNNDVAKMLFEYEKAGAIGADQILKPKAR